MMKTVNKCGHYPDSEIVMVLKYLEANNLTYEYRRLKSSNNRLRPNSVTLRYTYAEHLKFHEFLKTELGYFKEES